MNFEIPPELNVRFTGGPDDQLSTTRLAYLKKELRENPSVNPSYIRQGVQQFLPGLRSMIDALPRVREHERADFTVQTLTLDLFIHLW